MMWNSTKIIQQRMDDIGFSDTYAIYLLVKIISSKASFTMKSFLTP